MHFDDCRLGSTGRSVPKCKICAVAICGVLEHPNDVVEFALYLYDLPVPVSVRMVTPRTTEYAIPNEEVHLLRKDLPGTDSGLSGRRVFTRVRSTAPYS